MAAPSIPPLAARAAGTGGDADSALAEACGDAPSLTCRWVFEQTNSEFLADSADWLVARPLKIVAIALAAVLVSRLVRRLIRRGFSELRDGSQNERVRALRQKAAANLLTGETDAQRAQARAETLVSALSGLASTAIWTVAALLILGELNVSLGPLVAGAGIAGVALGFGAQSMVKDFLNGIFILTEDQMGVGDIVDLGDAVGTVETVTLRATTVRDVNGTVWHVPNGEILRVGNKSQHWSRALLDLTVAYDTDLREAQRIVKEVADDLAADEEWRDRVVGEPEVWGIQDLAADAVVIRLVIQTVAAEQYAIERDLRLRIKEAFDDAGIDIPFAQRTVWIRDLDPPLGGTPDPGPAS